MKVLQVIAGMGINNGGPTACTYILGKGLLKLGVDLKVLTFEPAEDDVLIANDKFIETIKRPFELRFGYSKLYASMLKRQKIDIIHANGLWQYVSYCSAKHAFKNKTPFIISPHGMLYPEALKISKYLKKGMLLAFQRTVLNKATIIHATCIQERDHIRELGLSAPVAIIPNPIELPNKHQIIENNSEIKRIGFIGRFAPIKNLEILIDAWALSGKNNMNTELVLIGDGPLEYKKELKNKIETLKIKNIVFTGFLKGLEKEQVMQTLTCLVLPSKSENFGMVVAEALSFNIPVIASKGSPWQDLEIHKCGWWIDIGVKSLKEALIDALQTNEKQLIKMGTNGRILIEEHYSRESVAKQMFELYKWVLTKENIPKFIDVL